MALDEYVIVMRVVIDPKQAEPPDKWDWPTLLDLADRDHVTIFSCGLNRTLKGSGAAKVRARPQAAKRGRAVEVPPESPAAKSVAKAKAPTTKKAPAAKAPAKAPAAKAPARTSGRRRSA